MSTAARDDRPARRGRGRPRGQDSAVVRTAALSAAIDLIARQGFAATSMAQVAEAAGISPSGLAHHFPSKPALLGAVLDHRDALDSLPLDAHDEGPWRVFDALVELAHQNMQRRQLVLLYISVVGEASTTDHPAHEWMLRHFDDALEVLKSGLRADQGRGHVRADAPVDRIARTMIALMDGLQLQWLLDAEFDMAAALGEHVAQLKRDWGTDQGGG